MKQLISILFLTFGLQLSAQNINIITDDMPNGVSHIEEVNSYQVHYLTPTSGKPINFFMPINGQPVHRLESQATWVYAVMNDGNRYLLFIIDRYSGVYVHAPVMNRSLRSHQYEITYLKGEMWSSNNPDDKNRYVIWSQPIPMFRVVPQIR